MPLTPEQLAAVMACSEGRAGTRHTIERAGLHDCADLIIALSQNGLALPKPLDTPQFRVWREQTTANPQPLLRRDG